MATVRSGYKGLTQKDVADVIASEARKVNKRTSIASKKAVVSRLLREVQHPPRSEKQRVSLLVRVGKYLKTPAYRALLIGGVVGGSTTSTVTGAAAIISLIGTSMKNMEGKQLASPVHVAAYAVASLLSSAIAYKSLVAGTKQLRSNFSMNRSHAPRSGLPRSRPLQRRERPSY
jgi:hypothetical protein